MAHIRDRYITAILEKAMGYSPIVGILGHRQVGKTTLLEKIGSDYVTLDQSESLRQARAEPERFLSQHHRPSTAIDECQLAPELFPALKDFVRTNKVPGRFLLSGSIRFTSRKAIRESLTGRIVNLELLPFSISELHGFEKPCVIFRLLRVSNPVQILSFLKTELMSRKGLGKAIPHYLNAGGLPGICFVREAEIRRRKFTDQLHTLLDRDLRFVYPTTLLFGQILELAKTLSALEGQIINYAELSRITEIGVPTVKKLLGSLESIFALRTVPCLRGEKGVACYFEDQGEALYLDQRKAMDLQLEALVYRAIRQEFFYQLGATYSFFRYSTRGGARIPLAVESEGATIGFLVVDDIRPTKAVSASANSFLKTFANSKVVLVSRHQEVEVINDRLIHLPFSLIV